MHPLEIDESGCILGLCDAVAVDLIVTRESAIQKVSPVGYTNPTFIKGYVIYLSLSSLS